MVTGLTLSEAGTVQQSTEKTGRWQSCGTPWCHQSLVLHLPTPELWALQKNLSIGVLELEGCGGDTNDTPHGSGSSKGTPGLC